MKRRAFLKSCVLATALVAAPMGFSSIAPKLSISNIRGYIDPYGGLVIGSPTGASKGAGTANMLDGWAELCAISRRPGETDDKLRARYIDKIHDLREG